MSKSNMKEFWENTLALLAKEDLQVMMKPAPEQSGREYETHLVSMCSFEGRRIRAWFTVPKDRTPGRRFPAVMALPGYGGDKAIPTHLAMLGYAVLTLYPRGQGESVAEWQLDHSTKLTYNLKDPERYYYRGAYMDCVRGVDFLCSREEIDPERIGVWGRSQGGGLTLATVALDRRPRAAIAEEPFLCNYPLSVDIPTSPYSELRDYLAEHPGDRADVLSTLSYFDPLNTAEDIQCPVLLNIGMKDDICPYNTIMPVFESIKAPKAMVVYPDLAHEPCSDFNLHILGWLARYIG